jgi:hypothetical protein
MSPATRARLAHPALRRRTAVSGSVMVLVGLMGWWELPPSRSPLTLHANPLIIDDAHARGDIRWTAAICNTGQMPRTPSLTAVWANAADEKTPTSLPSIQPEKPAIAGGECREILLTFTKVSDLQQGFHRLGINDQRAEPRERIGEVGVSRRKIVPSASIWNGRRRAKSSCRWRADR